MRSTQQFSVTLPNEMAALVRSKVASGEYASESEVIREGLRALTARERAMDNWLRQKALSAYDAYRADPSRGIALEDVRAGIRAGLTGDLLSLHLRSALHHLGSITGEIATDDLLKNIFSRFCIGK